MNHSFHQYLFPFAFAIFTAIFAVVHLFSQTARAESLYVTATVPAPLPTSPAIITSHFDQQHVTTPPVSISGTCGDGAYVLLYNNSILAGVGSCLTGNFTVDLVLIKGANQLQAKVYNITDNEGPASPPLTIILDSASLSESTSADFFIPQKNNDPPIFPTTSLLSLQFSYNYRVYHTNQPWYSEFRVQGGSPPYRVEINWSDGTNASQTLTSPGVFIISHAFSQAGAYQPTITVRDSLGTLASLQTLIIVEVNQKPSVPATASPSTPILISVGIVVTVTLVAEIFGVTQMLHMGRPKK